MLLKSIEMEEHTAVNRLLRETPEVVVTIRLGVESTDSPRFPLTLDGIIELLSNLRKPTT